MAADEPTPFVPDDLVRHARFVKSLARELAHDESDADELAAKTFEAALAQRPAGGPSLRMWLRRVVGRLFARARRDDVRRRRREELASPREATAATVDDVARLELERKVAAAFAQLDEPYRTTLFLRFFDDLKPREIAARMSVPVETVQTRTKRGVAQLRVALDEAHGGRRGGWHAAAIALAGVRGPVVATVKAKVGVAAAGLVLLAGAGWVAMQAGSAGERGDARVAAAAEAASSGVKGANAERSGGDVAKEGGAVRSPVVGDELPFLAGVVVDEAGAPVEGAAIVAAVLNRDDARNYYVEELHIDRAKANALAWSDVNGRFRVAEPPRECVGIHVWKEGLGVGEAYDLVAERAENQEVRVVLPKSAAIRGRIRDSEGRPIHFASIAACDTNHERRQQVARNLPDQPSYSRAVRWSPIHGMARVDGSFELAAIPSVDFMVVVESWGYAGIGRSPADATTPLDVVLHRTSLLIDVVDAGTRAPVDDARALFGLASGGGPLVDESPAYRQWVPWGADDISPRNRVAFSPETMRGWMKDANADRTMIRAQLVAPGHRTQSVDVELSLSQEPPHLTVQLEAGEDEPSLTGRILGGARVHVDVRFSWRDCKVSSEQSRAPIRSVDCDVDGRFAVAGLPAAIYRLYVRAPACGQKCFDVEVPTHDAIFDLKPAAVLEARVVDCEGQGVADVSVFVQTRDGQRSWIERTDATGTAVIDELPEGDALVAAFRYARDLHTRSYVLEPQQLPPDAQRTLVAGQRLQIELLLSQKRPIVLRLRDARDNPVADARIRFGGIEGSADWQEPGFADRLRETAHDPMHVESDGTVHLDLHPSRYFFEIDVDDIVQREEIVVPPRGACDFDVRLPIRGPTGTIHGRVFEFGSARPLSGAEVVWFKSNGSREAEALQTVTADEDGRFAFERVPSGPITIVAYGPQATHASSDKRIDLAEDVDLSLDLPVGRCHPDESAGARVATDITVVDDATGAPIEGSDVSIDVDVDGASVYLSDCETDHDGRARDQVTAAARYRINAHSPFSVKPPYVTSYETSRLTSEPVDGVLRATLRLHKKP